MHVNRTEGSHENGCAELAAEQLERDIRIRIGAERVHVDTDLLPLIVVACGNIAGSLAARAGHCIRTGTPVADRASFAVRSDTVSCGSEDFVIIHDSTSC